MSSLICKVIELLNSLTMCFGSTNESKVRTVLIALIGFMPTKGEGAIGALDFPPEERKALARKSQTWKCETCGSGI